MSLRFLRAYGVTVFILSYYLGFTIIKKILPEAMVKRINSRLHRKTARIIIHNILVLKGLYIKIGQTLSVMVNFLPSEFTQGLEKLQDAVPPHPYSDVEARFLKDFGKTPKEMFDKFEETPIASASLGQVHIAYLKDGTKLAVKLQYPNIDDTVRKDLKTIKKIFGLMNLLLPAYGFQETYNECAKVVLDELDFEREAKNSEKIAKNFEGKNQYVFPKVYWEYCSKKILTVAFVDGIKISHIDSLKAAGVDTHALAVSLIHAYCKQIFIDGIYHADPHPGNVIIIPDATCDEAKARIALIDFGATDEIAPELREGMAVFVEGLLKKDTRTMTQALKQMGFVAREDSEEAVNKIVEYFYSKIKGVKIENFKEIKMTDFQSLDDLFELQKMDISFKELTSIFHVPKDWILLERALLLTMGIVTQLDPQLNPVQIVLPYVQEFVLGKDKKLADIIMSASKDLMVSYMNLPADVRRTLKKLEDGKLTINIGTKKQDIERLYQGIHQLVFCLLLILSVVMGYLFHKEGNVLWVTRMKYVSGILTFLLGWSFLKNKG